MTRTSSGRKAADDAPPLGRFYGALGRLTTGDANTAARHRRVALGLIEEVSGRLHKISAERASKIDLHTTDLQVMILLELGSADHILKAAEIQRALGFTSGGVTRRLDSMIARELVERLPDPDDRRAWLVRLTDIGRELIRGPLAGNIPRNRRIEQTFAPEEWRELIRLLGRLTEALGTD